MGSLRLLCSSRSYIADGLGLINIYTIHLMLFHLLAAKRILRYVKGTLGYELWFPRHDINISDGIIWLL